MRRARTRTRMVQAEEDTYLGRSSHGPTRRRLEHDRGDSLASEKNPAMLAVWTLATYITLASLSCPLYRTETTEAASWEQRLRLAWEGALTGRLLLMETRAHALTVQRLLHFLVDLP